MFYIKLYILVLLFNIGIGLIQFHPFYLRVYINIPYRFSSYFNI